MILLAVELQKLPWAVHVKMVSCLEGNKIRPAYTGTWRGHSNTIDIIRHEAQSRHAGVHRPLQATPDGVSRAGPGGVS